jgi:crotonobetainyl-CoA:carnitine CoA-transferase CaiB-like acyl-CoA transferase
MSIDDAPTGTTGPLSGLVVVALEQAVAAPLATRHLADAGARVIKVERVGDGDFARHYDDALGPGFASWFVWLNRGKESIELDLKVPEGRAVLAELIACADVLVQNLVPGALERMGLGIDQLRARHPRLITCSVSGYGPDGPYRDRKAYDLLIQAEAGLISLTGTPEQPAKAGLSVADIAGGMYAYSNVLLALLQRGITGTGSHVEVSLFDALLEWLGHQVTVTETMHRLPRRAGAHHATIAPYGPFRCADGTDVVIAVQNTKEWRALSTAIDLSTIVDDPRFVGNDDRVTHAADLDATIAARTGTLSSDDLIERLEAQGLAWARVNDLFAVIQHPQLLARHRWVQIDTPNGAYRALRPPTDISGVEPRLGRVPALGEHTESVLAWLATTMPSQPSTLSTTHS